MPNFTSSIQIERWVMLDDVEGTKAELSVVFHPNSGQFEVVYIELSCVVLRKSYLFSMADTYQKLTEVRRMVDPDAFSKGQARFIQRAGRGSDWYSAGLREKGRAQ